MDCLKSKKFPLLEIIHHPITKDYKFELNQMEVLCIDCQDIDGIHSENAKKGSTTIKKNTPSFNSLKDIASDFGVKKENINVINNGLDIDIFIPYKKLKEIQQNLSLLQVLM